MLSASTTYVFTTSARALIYLLKCGPADYII